MKKLVGIILVVCMMIGIGIANADQTLNAGDAYDYVIEWTEKYGYELHLHDEVDDDGYKCGVGLLSANEFYREYKEICTMEAFKRISTIEYEMTKIEIEQIGEIEGYAIFMCTAEANKDLTWDGYKKCKVIFMLCE